MLLPNVYSLGYSLGDRLGALISSHSIPELPSLAELYRVLTNAPYWYRDWWLNLVSQDPVHVLVETTLLLSVLYMVVRKNSDWQDDRKVHLTEREKDELLQDWRDYGRAPLAPEIDGGNNSTSNGAKSSSSMAIVVHSLNGKHMDIQIGDKDLQKRVLNFATHDFLAMSSDSLYTDKDGPGIAIKEASRKALAHYGCGSCGPRGFYGTLDVHLDLEDAMSKFTHTDGAIMYSDGASTISSTVAAFAKRGDLLVVDDGVYEPLITGVSLSRANVRWFCHNDMDDLRRVLQEIERTDKRLGRKANAQRRFIVAEGLYKNSGTICPVDELVALKHEFKYRLILDESFSFGTLGATGRGALELYGKRNMYDAEIVTISLENTLGSIGGVTVGNEEVVDHQRLSGAGYCFSASSPPFTASAAIQALHQLDSRPELLAKMKENNDYFHKKLEAMPRVVPDTLIPTSDNRSPLIFLELSDKAKELIRDGSYPDDVSVLDTIVHNCVSNGIAVVSTGRHVQGNMHTVPPPAIRITVCAAHSRSDIDKALSVLEKAVLRAVKKR